MQILGDVLAVVLVLLLLYKLFVVPAKLLEKRGIKLWETLGEDQKDGKEKKQ